MSIWYCFAYSVSGRSFYHNKGTGGGQHVTVPDVDGCPGCDVGTAGIPGNVVSGGVPGNEGVGPRTDEIITHSSSEARRKTTYLPIFLF